MESIKEIVEFYENREHYEELHESTLRQVTMRINAGAYDVLERLSQRWGVSKSALAAELLEASIREAIGSLRGDVWKEIFSEVEVLE